MSSQKKTARTAIRANKYDNRSYAAAVETFTNRKAEDY